MRFIKIALFLIGLIGFSATTTYAQIVATTPNKTAVTTETIATAKTIKVKVKGVGCARDLQAISKSVAKVNGVSICETLKKRYARL